MAQLYKTRRLTATKIKPLYKGVAAQSFKIPSTHYCKQENLPYKGYDFSVSFFSELLLFQKKL